MNIVADENIPLLQEFFGDFGSIRRLPGRHIQAQDLATADILLVRSVTQVNAELLQGSPVRFVGSATIGHDHIDLAYLAQQQIQFANAPGCNADAVVDYVLGCLSVLGELYGFRWRAKRVGVIGCGNVGGRLVARLRALGMQVLAYDPILQEQGVEGLASLPEVLDCDVISLHTPLTNQGPYATYHLLNARRIAQLRNEQILINSGRGAVIEEKALLRRMLESPLLALVLDVWETEPGISQELLRRVTLGTPHIAGYSLDGKMRGTYMIYGALCRSFGLPVRKNLLQFLPEPSLRALRFGSAAGADEALDCAIRAVYDPRNDHGRMQRLLHLPEASVASAFDRLRKDYPIRREFGQTEVEADHKSQLWQCLHAAGFNTKGLAAG